MSYSNTTSGCRVEVRALSADPQAPSAGALLAWAEPSGDGWQLGHCDGRRVVVASAVEVVERLIAVACDVSLAERWRRQAGLAPAGSPQAQVLLRCAQELAASAGGGSGCCRGTATAGEDPRRCGASAAGARRIISGAPGGETTPKPDGPG